MKNGLIALNERNIKDRIYSIRGVQVLLDEDLAELYNVETKVLNQAVKRNIERFPERFMFQLTKNEFLNLRSQFVTPRWGGRRVMPFAFTEQGVAMLTGILKSETAVNVSIQIMDAFVFMRKFIAVNAEIFQRLRKVELKQIVYDKNFSILFKTIGDKDIAPKKGIFFDGQVFDAYTFISDIIRGATKSIILIDNYVDDTVLTLFSKR
jgi:hypothetical protein